jgi:hypothetical protein
LGIDFEEGEMTIEGQQWCFEGKHTLDWIKSSGDQRVSRSTEIDLIQDDGNLQQKLNSLSRDFPAVKKLTVRSRKYREDQKFSLEAALPRLEELSIDSVLMKKLVLTKELTPLLKKLTLVNVGDIEKCDFRVTVPLLQDIKIHFLDDNSTKRINNMLAAAKNLVSFDSYKLQVYGDALKFASNDLESISIRRSDCLGAIQVWAPRLQQLGVVSCYDMRKIDILNDHALSSELPSGAPMSAMSRFCVDVTNCCENKVLASRLRANPRVAQIVDDTHTQDF